MCLPAEVLLLLVGGDTVEGGVLKKGLKLDFRPLKFHYCCCR